MTRMHVGLYPGERVWRGPQSVPPHEYLLIGDVTLDDQKDPWGTLRIGYIVREQVELTKVALDPAESEEPTCMPSALLDLLRHRNLMMWVNSDIREYKKAYKRLGGPTTTRPAHRPPLTPDIWVGRADAIVETLETIADETRRAKELDFDDDPPRAYDILRDKWTDDLFDGVPSNSQIANRVRATRERGYITGDLRDESVAYGPAYLHLLDDTDRSRHGED